MSDGSALPTQFTLTSTNGAQAINTYTTNFGLTGVYSIIITVTDPKTAVSDSS